MPSALNLTSKKNHPYTGFHPWTYVSLGHRNRPFGSHMNLWTFLHCLYIGCCFPHWLGSILGHQIVKNIRTHQHGKCAAQTVMILMAAFALLGRLWISFLCPQHLSLCPATSLPPTCSHFCLLHKHLSKFSLHYEAAACVSTTCSVLWGRLGLAATAEFLIRAECAICFSLLVV